VLTAARVPEDERDLAAAASGPLGPHQVSVHSEDVPVDFSLALATSVFRPETVGAVPAVLIRTPYGKEFWRNDGIFWASHGYSLVLQDCRGTASYFDEADDGEATVKWIQAQDWFDGRLGLQGMSYMGFTAWATASRCKDHVDAISVSYYSSDRTSSWYPGGSFGLDMALAWSAMQDDSHDDSEPGLDDALGPPVASLEAYLHLPLIEADEVQTGKHIPFFRERLTHWSNDPHWQPLDFSHVLTDGCPPTLLFGGWYDYQRRYLWEDYQRLRLAGVPHRIVMGPWMHGGGWAEGNTEALRWFDTHVRKRDDAHDLPVSCYVTGSGDWNETAGWSDSDTQFERWYLVADGRLAPTPSDGSLPTRYTYDPSDPTPSVGLASFDPERAMPCDNRVLEERPDVVTFTSDTLAEPLTLFGAVSATLWVKSSAPSADFFVRLTDVHPDGASYNVIDALRRVEHDARLDSGEEPLKLEVDLGPCAHCFDTGHRLRVQISSGAFPFYVRNLGTGEDVATGTRVTVAEQTLFHDSRFPAHLTAVLASTHGVPV
jgi:putative CocE/NonD family hydrolase